MKNNTTYQNVVVQYIENDSWKLEQHDKEFLKEINFLNNENPKWEYTIDEEILQNMDDDLKGIGIPYITYMMIASYTQKLTAYQREQTMDVMPLEITMATTTKYRGMEQWYDEMEESK